MTSSYRANLLLPHLQPPAKKTQADGSLSPKKSPTQPSRNDQNPHHAPGTKRAKTPATTTRSHTSTPTAETANTTARARRNIIEDRVTLTQLSERRGETLAEQNLNSHRREETARSEPLYRANNRATSRGPDTETPKGTPSPSSTDRQPPPDQKTQAAPPSQLSSTLAIDSYQRHTTKKDAHAPSSGITTIA